MHQHEQRRNTRIAPAMVDEAPPGVSPAIASPVLQRMRRPVPERDAGMVASFPICKEMAAVRTAAIGTKTPAIRPRFGCPVGHVRHGRGLPPENGSADVLSGMEAWRLARRVVTSLRAFRGFPTTFSFPLLLANSSLVLFDSNHSKFNQNKKLAQLTKRDLNLIMVVRGKMDSTAINHTPFPKRSRRQ